MTRKHKPLEDVDTEVEQAIREYQASALKIQEDLEREVYESLPTHEYFGFRCSESQVIRLLLITSVFPELCDEEVNLH